MGIQLSFSAAERYLTSARSYFLHYLLRLRPMENSSALFFGAAVDDGLNVLLSPPLDRSPEALSRAKAAFTESWRTARINDKNVDLSEPGVVKYSKADADFSLLTADEITTCPEINIDPVWMILHKKGHLILEAYYEQIMPRIKEVLAVQKEISLKNDLGDTFTGIIDLIVVWEDGRTILMDNKTSSIKYAKDAIEVSGQLSTYYEAVKEEYKLDAVGYIIIPKHVRKKKLPLIPIEVMIGNVSEELINEQFEKYEYVLEGIKNGQFECGRNNEGGCCSKPWPCGYRRFCESGGTDTTGLVYQEKRK